MTIEVKGLKELQKQIDAIPNKTMRGVEKAIKVIYKKSQPLVPVDTGRLRKSGKITKLKNGYKLSYRALNPLNKYNYAPIQHENLEFRHKVGQAKYLEKAVRDNRHTLEIVKKSIVGEVLKK